MSMLTHRLERPLHSADNATVLGALLPSDPTATLKRLCLRALALLSMGSVLTLLIALKTAVYFWRFPV